MKILAVTTWFPSPQAPAVGAFVDKDVRALATQHDVEVVHLMPSAGAGGADPDGIAAHGGVETVSVDGLTVHKIVMSTQRPDQIVRARRHLNRLLTDVDVLHTMAFSSLLPFAFGARPRQVWVHTEHWQGVTARWHLPLAWRVVLPVLSRILLRPDVVTTVSEYATGPIAQLRGGRPTRTVACIAFGPASPPGRPQRAAADPLQLVAVGALVPMKDPLVAVRTIADLRSRGVAARLTWVGDGPLRDEVEQEVTALGVSSSVHLVGAQGSERVSQELAQADVFFLPTRRETFGVAIAEALQHGRPVVVGANGAQHEYVDQAVGALVEDQNPAAYADAIIDLAARTRALTAAQISATIAGRFTPQVVVAGYERAYAEARERASAAGRLPLARAAKVCSSQRPVAQQQADGAGQFEVDVVIAVHTTERPIARAVRSALENACAVRVTVVAHGVDPGRIEANLADVVVPPGSAVRVLPFVDGVPSPAGPFNHGLDTATARYVAVLGSDDRLAPGALTSWLTIASATGSAMVVARLAHASGAVVPTPPARPLRRRRLDPVADRLSYRSAPLGLLDRGVANTLGLRFTKGVEVGEDVAFVTRLWFSGRPIAFDRTGPAYLIEDDAADRATFTARPVRAELAFVLDLLAQSWFQDLSLRNRRAVCVKVLRIHIFGLLGNREPGFWSAAERSALRDVARAVLAAAPGCTAVLSRADRAVLDAISDLNVPVGTLLARGQARRRHGRLNTLMPRDLRYLFAREAPVRVMAASVIAQRG